MSIEVRSGPGEAFSDAIAIDFADSESGLFGLVQVELFPATGRARAIGLLFDHAETVAAVAEEAVLESASDWEAAALAGARIRPTGDGAAARLQADGTSFEIDFAELRGASFGSDAGAGLVAGASQEVAAGRVTGEVSWDRRSTPIDCFGRATRTWGAIDWDNLAYVRSIGSVFADGSLLAIWTARPARAQGHDEEGLSAAVVDERGEAEIERALVSTEYDAEGRHRRANVEILQPGPEEEEDPRRPLRAGGRIVCGTSVETAGLRTDVAFFRWSMEGTAGLGRYDVVRALRP